MPKGERIGCRRGLVPGRTRARRVAVGTGRRTGFSLIHHGFANPIDDYERRLYMRLHDKN